MLLAFSYSVVYLVRIGLQTPKFSLLLQQNQKRFVITSSFQCIFSIAIINNTFSVLLKYKNWLILIF